MGCSDEAGKLDLGILRAADRSIASIQYAQTVRCSTMKHVFSN